MVYWSYPIINKNKVLPAISVNKGCCSRQAITLQSHKGEPWGHSDGNRMPVIELSVTEPPPMVYLEETQDEQAQNARPRWLKFIWKELFQWVLTFSSSPTQKSSKFINLRYFVFFNWWWSFDVLTTWSLLQELLYILGPLFWTVSQSYLRGWVLGLNPQFCLPNKTWFSTLGCAFIYLFLVDITLLRKVLEIGNIFAKYFELNKLGEVREFERTVKKIFEWYIQYILTVNLNKI